MSTLFSSSLTGGFYAPISNKVVTMKFKTKGVKSMERSYVSLRRCLLQLLVVGNKRRMELSTLFIYELGPIIGEYGCLRNSNKTVIVQHLEILVLNLHPTDVVFVDASQLSYRVVWPLKGTVADFAARMGRRLDHYIT